MAGFKIIFGSHNGDFELTWTLNNKALSHNWLQKLDYVSKNKVIDNPRRFYGLPQASKVQIYNVMTESIHQLNQKGFDIPVKPIEQFDHDWLNFLHDYFAVNHGRDHEPKSINMSKEMVNLWNQLHINLHHYESLLLNRVEQCRINCTWREQGEMIEQYALKDYDQFTLNSKFGDVFINYRQVGRSAFHVYRSEDKLDKAVLVNSTDWCADFRINFFDLVDESLIKNYWEWYHNNLPWFEQNFGFTNKDPRVNPGFYPVASLDSDMHQNELLQLLSHSTGIKSIVVNLT